MLKHQYRLPSGTRISSQQTITTSLFLFKYTTNNLSVSRFGFVVSKKVSPQAVIRNRTRRVLRSVIEDLFPELKPGFDVLFVLRQSIDARSETLDEEVKRVLQRASLL